MFWISLITACFHGPPAGPTPAVQAAKIHPPLLVESTRSHVGLSLLVRGGSAADPVGKEGVGAILWQNTLERSHTAEFQNAGGQVRAEWRRDYGAFHYRWENGQNMEAPLLAMLKAQFSRDPLNEHLQDALAQQIQHRDTREADRGLPSLLDAWLQLGLAGHPYAHPQGGTWTSRAQLSHGDLNEAADRLFCTGNLYVAVSASSNPVLPKSIENFLNSQGPCGQEPPTPKPLPLAQGPQLLLLQSRGAGTHAFAGLPHRSTSHITSDEDLAWGAALIRGSAGQGPIQRAFDLAEIEASIKVRLSPVGERWAQPMILINIRSQDADPVQLFDALSSSLMGLKATGWTERGHHRHNQHLAQTTAERPTQARLESRLLAHVFGPTPRAAIQLDASATLEALRNGIQPDSLSLVMEVNDPEALEAHAKAKGFSVQVLKAEDFLP